MLLRALQKITILLIISNAVYGSEAPQPASKPNVIINALMKSGSEHLVQALQRGLNYRRLNIYSNYELTRQIYYSNIQEFFHNREVIAKQHLIAPTFNSHVPYPVITAHDIKQDMAVIKDWRELDTESLKKHTNKMVLHIRDPRPALLSFVHHVIAHQDGIDKPKNYFSLSFSEQLDWCIENLLPTHVKWIEDWLALKAREDLDPNGLKILVTTYDELIVDEQALFNKILAFYEIAPTNFNYQPIAKTESPHFRSGNPEEWRQVFTAAQQQRIAEIVPNRLLRRFNWQF